MLSAQTFLAWKDGDEPEDCQDSIYPPPDNPQRETDSYAVADGATTSFFSQVWAQILTRRFGEDPERVFQDWSNWLKDAQNEWRLAIETAAKSENASFFIVNGLHARRPAAAALTGITISQSNSAGWTWRAAVLGDSCLFRLSGNGEFYARNRKSSSEFSSIVEAAESWPKSDFFSPMKFGSPPYGDEAPICYGDSLVLVTDALAKWLLRRQETGEPVWGTILRLETGDSFQDFIKQARVEADDPLENDDVALVVLNFGETQPFFLNQTFTPRPRVEATPPIGAKPVRLLGDVEKAPVSPFRTTFQPTVPYESNKNSGWNRRAITSVVLSILLVLPVIQLIELRKRQSQLRRLTQQNNTLRSELDAANGRRRPTQLDKAWIDQLARENDAFKGYLQDLHIRLDSFPIDKGGTFAKLPSEAPSDGTRPW